MSGEMTCSRRLFQIFKAGNHTTMSGQFLTFTESDLRQIAAAYAWQKATAPAPLVLGHPADNLPSYGEVAAVIAEGDMLFADASVSPGLIRAVQQGAYKKISAAFYSPVSPDNPMPGVWSLRHIGFLGAQPPAVKGMASLEFGQVPSGDVHFVENIDIAGEPSNCAFSEAEALAARIAFYQAQMPSLFYSEVVQLVALR
jgi:hypothetical protein